MSGSRRGLPRAADVGIAALGLLLTSPLLALAAIAIKLGSRGPVIYRQERVGRGGEVFLDVPAVNREAVALAESLGLAPVFETARMYTGAIPPLRLERVFGVTTFELG